MRFDEFIHESEFVVTPVDVFVDFIVEVGMQPGWEPFESAPGLRLWMCRVDPYIDVFCANAVLTMHRVEAPLGAAGVFGMLVEQQLESVPMCSEVRRELAAATEGAGVIGVLEMRIEHELGTINSVSRSRIIASDQDTKIAQLSVMALADSPVNSAGVWMTVRSRELTSNG